MSTNKEEDKWGYIAKFEVKLLSVDATMPTKAHPNDAAFDLYTIADVFLQPKERVRIGTGIAIRPPIGWYYTIEGRSSRFLQGVVPLRGVIDAEYTQELFIVLENHTNEPLVIAKKTRVAQIIPHRVDEISLEKVEEFSYREGERGSAGWGSSGK
jgi:dUTP pyrophosphatase